MAILEPGKIFLGASAKPEYLLLPNANRHGLITGATGTGKTVSLQGMAEGFSAAGVPVFCADVKGDLAGLAMPGAPKDFLASRADKIESVSGLMNLVMMPMWIFSGVFFSSERFPALLQPFIKLLPLTALNDALRATILQGASLGAQSGRLLVLVLWGGISFVLALRWFRWT